MTPCSKALPTVVSADDRTMSSQPAHVAELVERLITNCLIGRTRGSQMDLGKGSDSNAAAQRRPAALATSDAFPRPQLQHTRSIDPSQTIGNIKRVARSRGRELFAINRYAKICMCSLAVLGAHTVPAHAPLLSNVTEHRTSQRSAVAS